MTESRAREETAEHLGCHGFDAERARADFPALRQSVHGNPLVYLDNAATTQKPEAVLSALDSYYRRDNANVHRGVHTLSERATRTYEGTREVVRAFMNAAEEREIVFTRGATEAINLVARSWGGRHVSEGDEVLITAMEHHANIVPWQMLCEEKGARLVVAPITDSGDLPLDDFERLLSDRTRIVAFPHVSNVLGTVNPARALVELAHAHGIPVLVDAAQSVSHMGVDVRELDAEFVVFSAHKVYGPTGVGVLYGKADVLEGMPPWQGGGDMIRFVSFERTTYNDIPYRFEAGTPHIAGVIGMGAALRYLMAMDRAAVAAHEDHLLAAMESAMADIPGLRILGKPRRRAGAISFTMEAAHPHDIATILDRHGVAVRAGHHCAQPLMRRFGVPATARASLALYNDSDDVDALVKGLHAVREVFGT